MTASLTWEARETREGREENKDQPGNGERYYTVIV